MGLYCNNATLLKTSHSFCVAVSRYHDAQSKCPSTNGNGIVDFYYNGSTPVDTSNCYGFFQATYTSDTGLTNISHLPLDYLVDYAGNLDEVTIHCCAHNVADLILNVTKQ